LSIFFLIAGLILLVVGGEFLVRSSVGLSFKLKLSKIVIGMTVVSFATSAPELLVSLQAALDGHPDLALSNVIGSNIANVALVLSITAIISPLVVNKDFYKMNWPMMIILSFGLYYFLINDHILTQLEGGILFITLVVFIYFMIKTSLKNNKTTPVKEIDESLSETSTTKIIIWLLIGGLALYFGSELLVNGAVDIATKLGVSERVIGLSMVAIGTSVPELAASVIAALRKEKAISLGNLIGSNIFNIASVLGLTAIITPINVIDKGLLTNDIIWMLAISIFLLPLILIPKRFEISRVKGLILLLSYLIFLYLYFNAS